MGDLVDDRHPDGDQPRDDEDGSAANVVRLAAASNGPLMAQRRNTPGHDEGPASEDHASDLGLWWWSG
jgi:hypothetical protein